MAYDGSGFKDFGSIKEQIPINNGVMPVAYGYLENIINKKEKDNVDVLVFSTKFFVTGDEVEVTPFAMMERSDEDHKILAYDNTISLKDWSEVSTNERELILSYFGFKGQIKVEDVYRAEEYINQSHVK